MSKILDGKKLSEVLAAQLTKKIERMRVKPKLVIIQIGDLKESNTYIEKKTIFAKKIGVIVEYKKYPLNTPESEVITDISAYNNAEDIHGIMVQLPIPGKIYTNDIIEAIDPRKDVDGLTAQNTKFMFDNSESFVPATTKGILTLLEHYNIRLAGKKVVIVGESALVGRPTALAFLNRNSTVTVCHSETKNLAKETAQADILIVAVGKPNLIGAKHVSKKQIILDVGINVRENKKVVGDVNYEKVKNIVRAITPVPGGVGPMTVLSLFENVIEAYSRLTQ